MMASFSCNNSEQYPRNYAEPMPIDFSTNDLSYNLKYVGLDPLNRIFLKLFIRDVLSLKETTNEEVNSKIFCFNSHVVLKVEIMGILVKVDLRDIRHAYVLDDGTGAILCNFWKNAKQEPPQIVPGLPQSLARKQEEVILSYTPLKEGFHLGDLVCVRGRVKFYAGQKEIDVLDMFKIDNPNCELNRVLELPRLYSECYSKPFAPPNETTSISSASELIGNPDLLKFKIVKQIEQNAAANHIFTIKDVLIWLSLKSSQSSESTSQPLLNAIKSALESISETHALICRRFDRTCVYEVVREGCGLCHEILKIVKIFQHNEIEGTGFHVKQISAALNKSPQYAGASPKVVQKALQILEDSSDLIRVDFNKYMPLT